MKGKIAIIGSSNIAYIIRNDSPKIVCNNPLSVNEQFEASKETFVITNTHVNFNNEPSIYDPKIFGTRQKKFRKKNNRKKKSKR